MGVVMEAGVVEDIDRRTIPDYTAFQGLKSPRIEKQRGRRKERLLEER
jgi:hypothetical protein